MSNIDYIKSYLVKLGVDVDSSDINKWESSLQKLDSSFSKTADSLEKSDKKVSKSFTNTFRNLAKSYGKIATLFTTASIGIGKFMQSVANSDMEMQKFARSMYLSTDQAKALQNTLNSMDLSIGDLRDVAYNPELLARYKEFLSLAKSFKTTPEMKQSFKEIRTIFAEFQKFNIIFNSFKERLTHFIYQTVKAPAQKFREFLNSFNTKFARNISKWAEKLGVLLGNILRVGLRVMEVVQSIIAAIGRVWDKLSGVSKGFVGALFLINRIIKGSPIWKLMTMFTGVMMLIDDYKTYKEGGISANALKPMWKMVENQRSRPDSAWNKLFNLLEQLLPLLNKLTDVVLKSLIETIEEIFGWMRALYHAGENIGEKVANAHIAAQEYQGYIQSVGPQNAILGTLTNGALGISKEQYEKSKNGGMTLANGDLDLYDFNHNRLESIETKNRVSQEKLYTPLPSQNNSNSTSNINQTFNFNLSKDSMDSPQNFLDEVSMLIRNNKSTLVGVK